MMRLTRCAVALGATLAVCANSSAQNQYDDWTIGVVDDRSMVFAGTGNDSGSFFGQYCDVRGDCEYRIGLKTRCDEGEKYPILINSNADQVGALNGVLVCKGNVRDTPGMFVYQVGPFDGLDRIVRSATRLGIAIPMQGDQFQVSRFSMRGSTAAITFMRGAAGRLTGSRESGIRDTRL